MNGRVYDYNLGRFLSVDPFIQDPGNSQSMNPYSYIMNNPLAGTDPSGYFARSAGSTTIWSSGKNTINITVALKNGKEIIIKTTKEDLNKDVSQLEGVATSSIEQISIASNYNSIVHKSGGTDYAWLSRAKRMAAADGFNYDPNLTWASNSDDPEDYQVPEMRMASSDAQVESFVSYFSDRVMSGQVRDDIFTFGGSLVSSFTFGLVEPGFVDRNSSAFGIGQITSLGLGGAGLVRSAYFAGTRGLSMLASTSGSESLVLALSGVRNFSKLATNPALWINPSLRSVHIIPASVRLNEAGSVAALAQKLGRTNTAVDAALIPLTPFLGAEFND